MERNEFMTDDDIVRITDYISDLINNHGDMNHLYSEWAEIEEYYENDQADVLNSPNAKINILNANIEGQTTMIVDQDIAIMTKGETASDDDFSDEVRIGLEWTFRKNYIKKVMKSFVRRYAKFGTGCFHIHFDPKAVNGFGLVKIHSMPLTNIFIDGKVKDPLRYQEADWIAECQRVSKKQLENIYGEDKAEAVIYGKIDHVNSEIFNIDDSSEDHNGATLVKYWSRCDGKLRLEEFTGDGLLLYDSHKPGNRKTNQKDSEFSRKSYYKFVQDKYPYFFSFLYEREGNLWAFGDGKLLLPLQKLLNQLYNCILITSRPDLPLIDTRSGLDPELINENPMIPVPYDGEELQGADPVKTIKWGTTNVQWWNLITAIHNEAQRVSRFSDIMTGQSSKNTSTATEAAIQQQQGSKATDDKKNDIQITMQEMCEYILGVMIEKYERAKSFQTSSDKKDYKWIDFRDMANVPVKIPPTKKFRDEFLSKNKKIPKWELLVNGDGSPATKHLEIDIEINIGAGLPKNKAFITKFLQDLAGVVMISEDGTQKPVVYWEEFRNFVQKYIGLPLRDEAKAAAAPQSQPQSQTPQVDPMANLSAGGGVPKQPLNEIRNR